VVPQPHTGCRVEGSLRAWTPLETHFSRVRGSRYSTQPLLPQQ